MEHYLNMVLSKWQHRRHRYDSVHPCIPKETEKEREWGGGEEPSPNNLYSSPMFTYVTQNIHSPRNHKISKESLIDNKDSTFLLDIWHKDRVGFIEHGNKRTTDRHGKLGFDGRSIMSHIAHHDHSKSKFWLILFYLVCRSFGSRKLCYLKPCTDITLSLWFALFESPSILWEAFLNAWLGPPDFYNSTRRNTSLVHADDSNGIPTVSKSHSKREH